MISEQDKKWIIFGVLAFLLIIGGAIYLNRNYEPHKNAVFITPHGCSEINQLILDHENIYNITDKLEKPLPSGQIECTIVYGGTQ